MTDQVAVEPVASPIPLIAPKLTPQQIQSVKSTLITHLKNQYDQFIRSIQGIAGEQTALYEGFELLDAGFLSLQKALILAKPNELPIMQQVVAPQPQAQPQSVEAQATAPAPEAPAVNDQVDNVEPVDQSTAA